MNVTRVYDSAERSMPMNRLLAVVITPLMYMAFMAVVTPRDAAAQFGRNDRDRDRVCFYQDIHYQGWEKCYFPGDELADSKSGGFRAGCALAGFTRGR